MRSHFLRVKTEAGPMAESDWNLNISYSQTGTVSNFPSSWFPVSTSPSASNSYKTTSIQATGTGSQTINVSGTGANTWYGVQESTDNTNWTSLGSTLKSTSTTLSFNYVQGRYYRFMVNYLGGPSYNYQWVWTTHYIKTSPNNYLIVGGSAGHYDQNG